MFAVRFGIELSIVLDSKVIDIVILFWLACSKIV